MNDMPHEKSLIYDMMSASPAQFEMRCLCPLGRLDPTELAALVCSIPDLTPEEQKTVISESSVKFGVISESSVDCGCHGGDSIQMLYNSAFVLL